MILAALVRKELIEIRRDPVTLATAVVLPLLLLFIFGYGITLDVKGPPRRCERRAPLRRRRPPP